MESLMVIVPTHHQYHLAKNQVELDPACIYRTDERDQVAKAAMRLVVKVE